MSLPDVIALHGFAQVGKDTTAVLLREHGYVRVAFADPIRDMLSDANPLVTVKNGDRIYLDELVRTVGWDEAKILFPEVRTMLQQFGMAARHHISEDVWADAANRLIQGHVRDGRRVVVTDLRFPNEVAMLLKSYRDRLLLVELLRPGVGPVNDHISDQGLPPELFDWALVNQGDLGDLRARIARMLEYSSDQRARLAG